MKNLRHRETVYQRSHSTKRNAIQLLILFPDIKFKSSSVKHYKVSSVFMSQRVWLLTNHCLPSSDGNIKEIGHLALVLLMPKSELHIGVTQSV